MLNIHGFDSAKRVFYFFEEITKIPHGSGNCGQIADYIENFAKENSLEYIRDKQDNLIIKKPATKGFEHKAPIAIQGHIDMVLAKDEGVNKDMTKEGLDLYIDGDFIKARGTTLGGDDGIAVAYAMALLESKDIPHPPIEVIFTTDEETGLFGAKAIDGSKINSRLLINIDSCKEGTFVVGCAGGIRIDVLLDLKREKIPAQVGKLEVSGLLGGHSGSDIDKGRTNAIRLICELLDGLPNLRISEINGGTATNVIPSSTSALIYTSDEEELRRRIKEIQAKLPSEEKNAKIEFCPNCTSAELYSEQDSENIVSTVLDLKNGIISMHSQIDGLVETSQNAGVISVDGNGAKLFASVRSAYEKRKEEICKEIEETVKNHGGVCNFHEDYPGWEYNPESKLRDVTVRTYRELCGSEPTLKIIHAGLECGILASKFEGLDAISMGPNNYGIHTSAERLSISSTARVWEHLKMILKEI